MEYHEVWKKQHEIMSAAKRKNLPVRKGQAYFIALTELRPELADRIRGTDRDCYYRDENVQATERWVQENWNGIEREEEV